VISDDVDDILCCSVVLKSTNVMTTDRIAVGNNVLVCNASSGKRCL